VVGSDGSGDRVERVGCGWVIGYIINTTTYTITDSQPNQIKIHQPNQSKKSHKHNNTYQKITAKKSKRKNHGKKKKERSEGTREI
jgi:hypothetical protein